MSEKLKPCPFCGSDKRYSYDHKDWCYLRLILTGRSGHMKSCDVDRAFNTRHDSAEVERLKAQLSEAVELIRHIQRENIQNYEFYEMDDIKSFLSKQEQTDATL